MVVGCNVTFSIVGSTSLSFIPWRLGRNARKVCLCVKNMCVCFLVLINITMYLCTCPVTHAPSWVLFSCNICFYVIYRLAFRSDVVSNQHTNVANTLDVDSSPYSNLSQYSTCRGLSRWRKILFDLFWSLLSIPGYILSLQDIRWWSKEVVTFTEEHSSL